MAPSVSPSQLTSTTSQPCAQLRASRSARPALSSSVRKYRTSDNTTRSGGCSDQFPGAAPSMKSTSAFAVRPFATASAREVQSMATSASQRVASSAVSAPAPQPASRQRR